MSVDGELLSAASLALGALAVVYGLWSPVLDEVGSMQKQMHVADRGPAIASMRMNLNTKALPLVLAAGCVCLVLAPSVVATVVGSLRHLVEVGPRAVLDYDPVQALFLVVWCMVAGLFVVSFRTWRGIGLQLADFERP